MDHEPFIEHRFAADDGLTLYARDYRGDVLATAERPSVVCLAGLSRNSRDFHRFAMRLSCEASPPRRVVTLDYRGRGQSERDPEAAHYTVAVESRDVLTACRSLGIGKADFIGTSRGGLILHLLADIAPERLGRIVLNDIGPVIEIEGLLAIATYLGRRDAYSSWDDAVAELKSIHAAAFPILDEDDWNDMARAIFHEKNGRIAADYDFALAEPLSALTPDTPIADLWPLFGKFEQNPLMVIRGENSTILSESTVREMASMKPDMVTIVARGQGHAPLLHRADLFSAITAFLDGS